ncbi:MAG: serine endoprotease [Gemmataceae bacterium]|nr:serine endoprotease [Gemmataceae bacterium]
MGAWFVRDRGRVVGPFTTEDLLDMRERGQVQGYHEVSPDRRTWKAMDLVSDFNGGPPAAHRAAHPPEPAEPLPRERDDPGRRNYVLVVGGVLALVVAGGLTVGGVLLLRSRPADNAGSGAAAATGTGGAGTGGAGTSGTATGGSEGGGGGVTGGGTTRVGEGVIRLTPRTPTKERDLALANSVGLVVSGAVIKFRDGATLESPEFGTGSGFAVTPNGYVITNRHVVEELANFRGSELQRESEKKLGVTFDPKVWVFFGLDNKYEAEIVHISTDYDLAVLKLNRTTTRYFALCQTEDPNIPMLDAVSSLGFPGSDRKAMQILNPSNKVELRKGAPIQRAFQDPDFNLTKENGGIKKNSMKARPDTKFREAYYLVHTARIAGGNSGGPLITSDGTVLGINTLGIVISLPGPGGGIKINQEGQNFALTMLQLRKEIDKNVPGVVWRELTE